MRDRPKLDPLDAWRALEDMRTQIDLSALLGTDRATRREALRREGLDPDEARRAGETVIREAAHESGIDLPLLDGTAPHEAITRPLRVGKYSPKPSVAPSRPSKASGPVWMIVLLAAAAATVGFFLWKFR